jgi:hypothetical protein
VPDPTDPRLAALQNVQDTSRAYGRGRRRREPDANVDPVFRAALETSDPEQRRAQMAEYARQRAQALFPQAPAMPPTGGALAGAGAAVRAPVGARGAQVVRDAFPQGNAFADVGSPPPSEADVMSQIDPDLGDEAYERGDEMRIDARDAADARAAQSPTAEPGDGIDQIGRAAQAILARRRSR